MPKNKQEGLIFETTMVTLMSSFMNLFNNFRHGGISLDSLTHALILEPVIFIVVMIVETLFVSKFVNSIVKKFASKDAKKNCNDKNSSYGNGYDIYYEYFWPCYVRHRT